MRRAPALAVLLAVLAGALAIAARAVRRPRIGRARIVDPDDHTTIDARGAVRSVQAAVLTLPTAEVDRLWTPHHLERLASTYWRFLTRATLGLVRIAYTEDARFAVLLTRPFVLLSFRAPEYEVDARRGVVRWRIAKGVLVAPAGREGDGYLEIDVRRCEDLPDGTTRLHVEVEVANFYPMLASRIATGFYSATQSRIHVLITHGFLRSLARLDLAESRVGRFSAPRERRPWRRRAVGRGARGAPRAHQEPREGQR